MAPLQMFVFLRYFAASGLSRSWLCSAVKMRGLSGSIPHAPAPASVYFFVCPDGGTGRQPPRTSPPLPAAYSDWRPLRDRSPHRDWRGDRRRAEYPLLQQLLVNQPVKGLAIFKLIDAHHHRFRERVILSGIGVERFARGKVQMQRINFLIKNGVEGRLCSLRDALGESASAQAKRKQGSRQAVLVKLIRNTSVSL